MSCCNNRPQKIIIDCGGGTSETVEFVASNANLTGIGVFLAQGDTTLTFRGIASAGGTIAVTADNTNQTANLEVNTSAIVSAFPDASTTTKGKVELATDAEAVVKADTVRALTPSNLAALASTSSFVGMTRFATNVETQAGTLDTVAVTPAGLDYTLAAFPTMQVFADNAARAAAAPAFVGQISIQQDSKQFYVGTGLSAGNWESGFIKIGANNYIESGTVIDLSGGLNLNVTNYDGTAGVFSISDGATLQIDPDGRLNFTASGKIQVGGTDVPASSVILTSSTAGQVESQPLTLFFNGINSNTQYFDITNDSTLTVIDADTITLPQLADVVCTLIKYLENCTRPVTTV